MLSRSSSPISSWELCEAIMLKPKLVIFILAAASFLAAETKGHGTNVRETTLHVSPGNNTEKLVKLERGRDLVVLEQTNIDNRQWIKVYATIPQAERAPRE